MFDTICSVLKRKPNCPVVTVYQNLTKLLREIDFLGKFFGQKRNYFCRKRNYFRNLRKLSEKRIDFDRLFSKKLRNEGVLTGF
jgi:hypothetical protein